ncbi:jg8772 [Pararge aegeria aegeria]|uniref:Jg8772 protein n=1 Tax=Pararge aegeria aegeria TaxID=348720 RepID=A0A8S4S2G1_9NEOP|nr:jg8772 [Pararge aegeria aegeria]
MLANFMEKEGLFMMNSFYEKRPHRKWTWLSPDGSTRNEIDFIMSTKLHIFNDVSVINRVKTGSDHRMVRGTLNINVKLERVRLVKSTLRTTRAHIKKTRELPIETAKPVRLPRLRFCGRFKQKACGNCQYGWVQVLQDPPNTYNKKVLSPYTWVHGEEIRNETTVYSRYI